MKLKTDMWKTELGKTKTLSYLSNTIYVNVIALVILTFFTETHTFFKTVLYIIIGIQTLSAIIITKSHKQYKEQQENGKHNRKTTKRTKMAIQKT